jgi:hypothetical protein
MDGGSDSDFEPLPAQFAKNVAAPKKPLKKSRKAKKKESKVVPELKMPDAAFSQKSISFRPM